MSIRPLHFGLRPKEVQDSRALYLRPQLKAHPHSSFAKTAIRHGRKRGPRPRSEQRRSRPLDAMPASDSKALIPASTRVSSHATMSTVAHFLRACGVALRCHLSRPTAEASRSCAQLAAQRRMRSIRGRARPYRRARKRRGTGLRPVKGRKATKKEYACTKRQKRCFIRKRFSFCPSAVFT